MHTPLLFSARHANTVLLRSVQNWHQRQRLLQSLHQILILCLWWHWHDIHWHIQGIRLEFVLLHLSFTIIASIIIFENANAHVVAQYEQAFRARSHSTTTRNRLHGYQCDCSHLTMMTKLCFVIVINVTNFWRHRIYRQVRMGPYCVQTRLDYDDRI